MLRIFENSCDVQLHIASDKPFNEDCLRWPTQFIDLGTQVLGSVELRESVRVSLGSERIGVSGFNVSALFFET
jgi:hypothetical protein